MKKTINLFLSAAMLNTVIMSMAMSASAQTPADGQSSRRLPQTITSIFTWQQGRLNPTVSGRVFASNDPTGMAVAGAMVYLTDSSGTVRSSLTNSFGYYRFASVVGATCVVAVEHKRYHYESQFASLDGDVVDFDFFPAP